MLFSESNDQCDDQSGRVTASQSDGLSDDQSGEQHDSQPVWKQRLQRLCGSDSFWLHVLRAKWMERNADVWERSNNATRVCGADRAVELVESVKLVEHTTWSGNVQYVVVGVLHGL